MIATEAAATAAVDRVVEATAVAEMVVATAGGGGDGGGGDGGGHDAVEA